MKLKICGMKYSENIVEISELLPDFMGFIFWEKSTRYFDEIIPEIPKSIKKAGIFVGENAEEIAFKIKQYQLDLIQLHGNETPETCRELQQQNVQIIKVFSIGNDFNFDDLKPFENSCDYFLFDTKGKFPGGNGVAFDWKILEKYDSEKPIFLSGGIGIEDISKIKKLKIPIFAIDVNSKFETQPGSKNIDLLQQFKSQLL